MKNLFQTIIVHYDEINLKGDNQGYFIRLLIENIKKTIAGDGRVKKGAKKIIIEILNKDTEVEVYLEKLRLVPGIANLSPAIVCESNIEQICDSALSVARVCQPKTFKIETTRADKSFALNSMQISSEVGGYVLDAFGENKIKVDVHRPELAIRIELEKDKTLVLGKKYEGVGGLPVGTAGKMLCLLSGGIDSPVAAFLMMKRGASVDFIHFHNQTINKKGVEEKIKDLVRRLSSVQGKGTLFIVPFAELQKEVIAKIPSDVRMIVYRRLMFRIAEQIAKKRKARALITGDSLSQVASQTIDNLEVIYSATSMLKFSPLIGFNKKEIIEIARKIGTYDISIRPYGDCCSLMIAMHPETKAKIDDILNAEMKLEVEKLIETAIEGIIKFEVKYWVWS